MLINVKHVEAIVVQVKPDMLDPALGECFVADLGGRAETLTY